MADDANLPIIPDKVVDKIRKGKSVALEEVSEAAAEMADTRKAERARPVHAEDLKPISKAQAAEYTRFDGQTLPRLPQTRRVIPAPFQRPRISIQVPWEAKPEWGYCRADEVLEGDIIPDIGKVVATVPRIRYESITGQAPITVHDLDGKPYQLLPEIDGIIDTYHGDLVAVGTDVRITGQGGNTETFDAGDQVRVFRIQEQAE